jgi:probable phosphoglycerate mutase
MTDLHAQDRLQTVYLVRHGETAWSLSGQHAGRTDIPLTARGEDEAAELGRRLRGVPFVRVMTSPRQRARQTCELAALSPAAETEPGLAEWDYGDYEGLRSADILRQRPDWNLFRDGCPGGESPAQVSDRADRLIARLRGMPGDIALFSHGHFGRVLGARWIGLPVRQAQCLLLDTASISVLDYEHHRRDEPVIAIWNAGSPDRFGPAASAADGGQATSKSQALERWENEGGEIPDQGRRGPSLSAE